MLKATEEITDSGVRADERLGSVFHIVDSMVAVDNIRNKVCRERNQKMTKIAIVGMIIYTLVVWSIAKGEIDSYKDFAKLTMRLQRRSWESVTKKLMEENERLQAQLKGDK